MKTTTLDNILCGILSLIVPGLGQLFQGRFIMGFIHIFFTMLFWVFGLGWIIHIASGVGAARYNMKYNK